MVLFFSGTGNSRYVAEKIGEILGETPVSINDRIKKGDLSPLHSDSGFTVCTPTYAWRIPHIVEKHLLATEFTGSSEIRFVMTCGDDTGDAPGYLKQFCEKKGLIYKGLAPVIMPENYIAMYPAPDETEARAIIEKADPVIIKTGEEIRDTGEISRPHKPTIADKAKSGIINSVFYSFFVGADKFTVKDNCIGCGLCEKKCPLNNIKIEGGRPVWGKECTHCMACICHCPTDAIEYGKKSVGQPRYHI